MIKVKRTGDYFYKIVDQDRGEGEDSDNEEEEEIGEMVEREEMNSGEEEEESEEENVREEVESGEEPGEEEDEEEKKDPVARERIIKIGENNQLKSKQDNRERKVRILTRAGKAKSKKWGRSYNVEDMDKEEVY